MSRIFEFTDLDPDPSDKSASGLLRQLERGIKKARKKLIPTAALNDFWRAGRGALDSLALSSGIPLSNLRQSYRGQAIDPDKFDAQMDELLSNTTGDPTADEWDQAVSTAEDKSKLDFPIVAIAGVILGSILLFSQRKRIGRGFRSIRTWAGRKWKSRKMFRRRGR